MGINTDSRRRHPETRVLLVEVRGTQHDTDRLSRHDGEILSTGEVSQTELQVADDIGVLDVLVAPGPVQDRLVVGVVIAAIGLADVVTSREQLVVLVGCDPEGLAGECGAVVDCAAGLGEERGAGGVEDLVADGLLGDGVHAVGVDDVPCAVGLVAVVCGTFQGGAEGSLLAEEGVSVLVLGGADGVVGGDGVALNDGVVGAVDLGVDTEGEEVLVVVGGDLRSDLGAVGSGLLGGVEAVGVQHTSELHFELVGTVEGEGVVEAVLVVGGSDDLRDDELAVTGRDDGTITVVGVLVQKTVVLLVDTDGVLDHGSLTVGGRHNTIHVVDGTLAITTQLEGVGHETSTVLTNIEGVLLVVGALGAAVGDNHFDDTDTVEKSTLAVLVHVVGADVGDDDTLAVVEANVHLEVGPRQLIAADLEGDTLRLGDVDRLEAIVVVLVANEFRKVVVLLEGNSSALAIYQTNINAEDLLSLGISHDSEVERVGVLVVKLGGTVISETLLQTALKAPALIDTNGPSIQEDLRHISDTQILASANDTRVLAGNALHHIQILQSKSGHHILDLLDLLNLALGDVDNNLGDLVSLALNDNGESAAIRSRNLAGAEGLVFGLAGLPQCETVEFDSLGAKVIANDLGSIRNFADGQLIYSSSILVKVP